MQTIPLKGIYPDLEKEGASRFDRREDTSKGSILVDSVFPSLLNPFPNKPCFLRV